MLSAEQRRFYENDGYLFPLRVFNEKETAEFREQFDEYTEQNKDRLRQLIPRERRAVYGLTHLMLPWVYRMVSHPRVLDAVEGAIGPTLLVWGSDWFVKFPGDAAYISWHQDGAYWGLQPPQVTTAWIALSPSTLESGCMQVMPGTQKTQLPQRETYALDNALSARAGDCACSGRIEGGCAVSCPGRDVVAPHWYCARFQGEHCRLCAHRDCGSLHCSGGRSDGNGAANRSIGAG